MALRGLNVVVWPFQDKRTASCVLRIIFVWRINTKINLRKVFWHDKDFSTTNDAAVGPWKLN